MKFSANVIKAFTILLVVALFTGFVSSTSETVQLDESETEITETTSTTQPESSETQQPESTTTPEPVVTITTKTEVTTTAKPTTKKSTTTTAKPAETTTQPISTLVGATTLRDPLKPMETRAIQVYVTDLDGSRVTQMDEFGSQVYVTSVVYETVDSTDLQDETKENEDAVYSSDTEKNNFTTKKVVLIILIISATIGTAAFALSFLGKKT